MPVVPPRPQTILVGVAKARSGKTSSDDAYTCLGTDGLLR